MNKNGLGQNNKQQTADKKQRIDINNQIFGVFVVFFLAFLNLCF